MKTFASFAAEIADIYLKFLLVEHIRRLYLFVSRPYSNLLVSFCSLIKIYCLTMERWQNRVAMVTGASAGIGAAIALDLVKAGMIVVALARRETRLQELRLQLSEELRKHFHPLQCDVADEGSVKRAFRWVEDELGGVHVLVSNAGVMLPTELVDAAGGPEVQATVNTNVMGTYYCVREAFNQMVAHGVDDGHVVVMNSICGHQTPNMGLDAPSLNMYAPTKHALTSMVEMYRREFLKHGTKIRVTSISPGAVDTEIFVGVWAHIAQNRTGMLKSEDVSNAVLFALAAPPHVQIHEIIMKPVGEVV